MMTKRDVLSMAFRVLGVWYLISVIMSIPDLLFYMYPPADIPDRQMLHIGLKGFFIDYAVLLALACILMGAADGLARRFVHDDAVINIPVGVNLRDVFRMLLKVIGLAIVAVNLPAVIRLVSPLFQKFHMISD
ncbi:MAG: hypothetical protein ABFD54_14315, partial [Armatimonadota bacterium]|nr:hypothetical protein [bacterium]